jgi:hypothetical protein
MRVEDVQDKYLTCVSNELKYKSRINFFYPSFHYSHAYSSKYAAINTT